MSIQNRTCLNMYISLKLVLGDLLSLGNKGKKREYCGNTYLLHLIQFIKLQYINQ